MSAARVISSVSNSYALALKAMIGTATVGMDQRDITPWLGNYDGPTENLNALTVANVYGDTSWRGDEWPRYGPARQFLTTDDLRWLDHHWQLAEETW